jgi:ribosome-associated protein
VPRVVAAEDKTVLSLIERTLDDGKAEDVVVIDLTAKSSIADSMVIATGRSQRQVAALAQHLRRALETHGVKRLSTEGEKQGDWVLIDAGDIIVHLFRPEVRAFYNLEKMWGSAFPESSLAIPPAPPSAKPYHPGFGA